jgi:hypothetical protein
MNEDVGAAGASALTTGHMSDRMSSRIAVVGGRRRWSVDQKLAILREAFGPDGSVSATCQRHAVGSGMLYTWRRQALGSEAHTAVIVCRGRGVGADHGAGRQRPHRDRAAVGRAAHRRRGGRRRCAGTGDVRPCPMIPLPPTTRIYLACGATDMRKGLDGLAVLVQQVLETSPHSGALFAFRGKRGDLVKQLWYDGQGLCLFSKRMDRGGSSGRSPRRARSASPRRSFRCCSKASTGGVPNALQCPCSQGECRISEGFTGIAEPVLLGVPGVGTSRQPPPVTEPPRRLYRSLQLRSPAQDPQRPHALRIYRQNPDGRARTVHHQSNPTDAGTEHLDVDLQRPHHCTATLVQEPSTPSRHPSDHNWNFLTQNGPSLRMQVNDNGAEPKRNAVLAPRHSNGCKLPHYAG